MDNLDSTTKLCRTCQRELPATDEYFYTRDGKLRTPCKSCIRAKYTEYYSQNSEGIKRRVKQYRISNAEKVSAKNKQWQENNPEKVKQYKVKWATRYYKDWYEANGDSIRERARNKVRDWRANNREQHRQYSGKWSKDNPEKRRRISQRYTKRHPDKVNSNTRNYRSRKRGAEGKHTAEDVQLQYKSQKGLCWWCGNPVGEDYHVDHRIPLSRGGTNWPNNICIACATCNESKNNKLPYEWNGRLL